MKKINLGLLAFSFLFISLWSCKKETPKQTLIGYWKGTYSPAANSEWSWLMRADSTMRVYIGLDTLNVSTKIFEGNYKSISANSIAVKYRIQGGFLVGFPAEIKENYTRMDGTDFSGTAFYVQKQ